MLICGVGDNVVDRYVEHGLMFPGGNALNVAVFARRAGARAAYLGITGSDLPGRIVREALAAEAVETTRLRVHDSFNAFSQIGIDAEGNRYFIGSTPPPYRLVLDRGDFDYLSGFDVIHTGDYGQLEEQLPAVAACGMLSFDFGSKPLPYAERLLPFVNVATFSAPGLTEAAAVDQIRWAQSRGPDSIIVTRGARGSIVARGEAIHVEPALAVSVEDSLGAGDAYVAVALTSLLGGADLAESAFRAARAAADVCTHMGAFGHGAPLTPLPAVTLADR